MPYAATWTNGAAGRLQPVEHRVRDDDAAELAEAVNRRRRLVYLGQQDFSSQIGSGKPVRVATLAGQVPPPFKNLRGALSNDIIAPIPGGLGGEPASPAGMEWLWPVSGQDENKVIVFSNAGSGQVALTDKLNGTASWTDPAIAGCGVRAVHFNELRQSIEWLIRGRWRLPIYFAGGVFSLLPDTPWIGDSIAHNEYGDELRCVGLVLARTTDSSPLGLTGVTVRDSTRVVITADLDCQVQLYHCLRPIDYLDDPPTWNQYAPLGGQSWSLPGGTGGGDAELLGALDLSAGQPGELSNAALAAAVQAMIDGDEQNFLIRRGDTGYETIGVVGELVVEFDLDSPPN